MAAAPKKKIEKNPATLKVSELIDFDVWFMCKLHEGAGIKAWQKSSVREHMRSAGLGERENRDKYEESLKKY